MTFATWIHGYPGVWIEVDLCVAAGVQAWEFFNKGIPVPLLLRLGYRIAT